MAQVKSVIEIFDASSKERKKLKEVGSEREFQNAALNLIAALFIRNQNAGKQGDERFRVYGVHREKGIHRRFNLAQTVVQNNQVRAVTIGEGVTQETILVRPDVEYGGALNHAEMLLTGEWRVVDISEEAALAGLDEAERTKVLVERNKEKHGSTDSIDKLTDALLKSVAKPVLAKG